MSPGPASGRISSEAELAEWCRGLVRTNSRLSAAHRAELTVLVRRGWQEDAACAQADPEAWFPEVGSVAGPQVLTTCARCPVQRTCLAAALLRAEFGVWAGTTDRDRRVLYRMLKAGASVADVVDHGLAGHVGHVAESSAPLEGAA